MLDLILAWANIDTILKMLYAHVVAKSYLAVVDEVEKWSGQYTFEQIRKSLADYPNPQEAQAFVRKKKKKFDKHAKIRNLVAHAPCIGALPGNKEQVVFAPFDGKGGKHLTPTTVPLDAIMLARDWGEEFYADTLRMLNALFDESEKASDA